MRLVPYRELGMDKSVNEMFSMMDQFFNSSLQQSDRKVSFRLDILENDNDYTIEGELPGINRENIQIDFDKNLLKISVNKLEDSEASNKKYLHRERKSYAMERTLRFKNVDAEAIEAKLEHGILTVVLPKLEEVITKKSIEIQ